MRKFYLVLIALGLVGCTNMNKSNSVTSFGFPVINSQNELIMKSNFAGDELSRLPRDFQDTKKPVVIMTTVVDSNDFMKSSTLGRTTSEIISGKLVQNGFPVKEIRLRSNILVKGDAGELLLSRDFKQVAKQHNAQAVVIGTYSEAAKNVIVSTKMIRLDDEQVISSNSFSIEKTDDIATLLHGVRFKDKYPLEDGEEAVDPNNPVTTSSNEPETLMDTLREYDKNMNDKRMKRKLESL